MRLHGLRMQAFGPFADEQVVDFDDLGTDGLFLLHGQTGAGKTTVLDAVAFALFGRVPGARDTNRRLHSDHAPAEQVPEVELEATIGGRRLRILRSPEYHRPKKRGTGTTKVQAHGTLVWVDGSGPDLTRLPEIGEAVTRLLGMSADQFFQVVLLPQGEFARFLRATSDERELLLERLFDTERFGDIEEWLRERARRSAARLEEKAGTLDRIAGQITGVSGAETPAEPDLDWAQNCLEVARDQADAAQASAAAATVDLERARTAHQDGMRTVDLRRRGVDAAARLTKLDAGKAELDKAAAALAAARRAATILPVADDHLRAHKAAAAAHSACADALAALTALEEGAALCGAGGSGQEDDLDARLDAAVSRWTGESARWEPLAQRMARRPGQIAEIERLDAEIEAAGRRLDEIGGALAAAPLRRETAVAALTAALDARSEVTRLREQHERLTTIGKAVTSRDALVAEIAAADTGVARARDAHAAARDHRQALRERRLTGMAAELAAELTDGRPCVVCGSVAHPAPASRTGDAMIAESAEKAAAAAEDRAAEDRRRAESELAVLTERRTHVLAIAGEASRDQIVTEFTRVAGELGEAEHLVAEIPQRDSAVAAVDAEVEAWRTEHSRVAAERSGTMERRTAIRTTVDELDAEVTEATGGSMDIAARRTELAELCTRATALREARREASAWTRRHDEIGTNLGDLCIAQGFPDVGAARAASAAPKQIAAWEEMLTRAAQMRAAARETLADPAVVAAMDSEPVDVETLSSRLADSQTRHEQAARRHAVAGERLHGLEGVVADFWAALDAIAPLRAKHAEVSGLAELFAGRGHNARKMSLHAYVLAARLEEVLVAASARLRQMSAGRYEFVHSDAVGPRGRRGGLGIEVRDEYTGAIRATTTLSGGETFYASLALALGLADVVSAESGGRVLDTIFIDEGFGTLDPEALDEVMGVLDELRSGGRVVGVVSHVDELRARIPSQLHVLRGESGSTIRVESAAAVG
ncbi:AAA family ATPase [Gordonia sp. NPDC003376]